MLLSRVRVVLRVNRPTKFHAHQAGILYATICAAYKLSPRRVSAIPDGVMLDAPEVCRTRAEPGEDYAFGLTIFGYDSANATVLVRQLLQGLKSLSTTLARKGEVFMGNFSVVGMTDLVSNAPLTSKSQLSLLGDRHVDSEVRQLEPHSEFTLQFTSPLRMHRSASMREPNHHYFDAGLFESGPFVRRLTARLRSLGISQIPQFTEAQLDTCAESTENRLTWLDLEYGPKHDKTSLGGSLGTIRLRVHNRAALLPLVLGQYLHCGADTRYGFGAYRIAELGIDPFECPRSSSLLEYAFAAPLLDEVAHHYNLESGVLREASRAVLSGLYIPPAPFEVPIPKSNGETRLLKIPPLLDRALQRVVHNYLAPGIDCFLEYSSFAYRRGLSRRTAALSLRRAYRDGFRFALRADFRRFFDNVNHDRLRQRLSAYVGDPAAVKLLMSWAQSGSPDSDRGIPTGAPVSPLLTNLFLDEFDEEVSRQGARLVRYADDFVLLFRDRDQADAIFRSASEAAENLYLTLNDVKTSWLDLNEPFDYLGYRFERKDRWTLTPLGEPRAIDDLGWSDARKPPTERETTLRLPSETGEEEGFTNSAVIVGPRISQIRFEGADLVFAYAQESRQTKIPVERIQHLVVLGPSTLTSRATAEILRHRIPTILCDGSGLARAHLVTENESSRPDILLAQAAACTRLDIRVNIARALVEAKLRNYAVLADATRLPGPSWNLGDELRALAERATRVTELDELLGVEGTGARFWYSSLDDRIPAEFDFRRRVAPDARDPVNALLNLAQTLLYRYCAIVARQAGLESSLGFFHHSRTGFDALASDLQEPFRYLADRVVFEALPWIDSKDVKPPIAEGERLQLSPSLARDFVQKFYRALHREVGAAQDTDKRSYRTRMQQQARSLRAFLLDPDKPFTPFLHP